MYLNYFLHHTSNPRDRAVSGLLILHVVTKKLVLSIADVRMHLFHLSDEQKERAASGIEPETTPTQREYHTPRPSGHKLNLRKRLFTLAWFLITR